MKFVRGSGAEVGEALKKGDADLAIAGPLGEIWERFDSWALFTEPYDLVVGSQHRLAGRNAVRLADIKDERLLTRVFCEQADQLSALLRGQGSTGAVTHRIATESDVMGLLAANVGVAIVPRSVPLPPKLQRIHVHGLELMRTVSAYGVAGRPRSPVASALLKALRASDWARFTGPPGDLVAT